MTALNSKYDNSLCITAWKCKHQAAVFEVVSCISEVAIANHKIEICRIKFNFVDVDDINPGILRPQWDYIDGLFSRSNELRIAIYA